MSVLREGSGRRWLTLVVGAVVASVLAVAISFVFGLVGGEAVHDTNTFELDGNAVDGGAAGDDWDTVLLGGGGSSLVNTGVIADPAPASIFTQGGSKDIRDVSDWRHTDGSVPDKDDITNAYAAAYNVGGDQVIYFGADRFANNGDSQIGFWFFQNDIGLNPNGTFSGVHAVGDVLILSDFTQGGAISTTKVFEWVGSGGSDGALDLVDSGVDCIGLAPGDDLCATVNSADASAPWPYTPKSGPPGTFPTGSFFEGGLNLTDEGLAGCFSSFLAETRSSQSPTAQLKDFALGQFDVCGIEVTKSPSLEQVCEGFETEVTYTYTVENTGAVTLTNVDLVDDVLGDITLNDTLTAGQTKQFEASTIISQTTVNTVTASGDALGLTPAATDTAQATVTASDCDIEVTKSVNPAQVCEGSDTAVTYTFHVINAVGLNVWKAPGASVRFRAIGPSTSSTTSTLVSVTSPTFVTVMV